LCKVYHRIDVVETTTVSIESIKVVSIEKIYRFA